MFIEILLMIFYVLDFSNHLVWIEILFNFLDCPHQLLVAMATVVSSRECAVQ